MTDARILHMRVEWFAEHYRGPKFHAILCDPPYGLEFMNVAWDTFKDRSNGRPRARNTWGDHGSREHPREASQLGRINRNKNRAYENLMREYFSGLAEHLHPGGFGMAFASSRGWHRLAVAIEDAGLIIHPSIFGWAFGSGFPKATRIDTQVDRDAGAEREVVGKYPEHRKKSMTSNYWQANNGYRPEGEYPTDADGSITAPATDLAQTWQGHRYGLQALKPALEPIIVFQKPYSGRPVDNIVSTGAGALNIDGARVATDDDLGRNNHVGPYSNTRTWNVSKTPGQDNRDNAPSGRWPANLLLLDDDAAAALDAQSGESVSSDRARHNSASIGYHGSGVQFQTGGFSDSGGASRFFYRVRAALDDADPVCYTAKASRAEREAGLEGHKRKFLATMNDGIGVREHNPQEPGAWRGNHHPTVKPLDLARYLAGLLLPPDEYAPRRILVPFAGSGSECIGAFMAGWDEIVGVEFTREYVDIARARLAYWMAQGVQLDFIDELTA